MSEAARLWAACVAEMPPGWRLTSDVERGGFRVRAFDDAGQVWVSRLAVTLEDAVRTVRTDLHDMPLWLRERRAS